MSVCVAVCSAKQAVILALGLCGGGSGEEWKETMLIFLLQRLSCETAPTTGIKCFVAKCDGDQDTTTK